MKNNDYAVLLVTAKDIPEAQKIADGLLRAKLVACANIVPGVQSLFWWQGKIDQANEVLLVLKTKAERIKEIITKVKSLHSYDVPEIIAVPIIAGAEDYLKWLADSVK